MGYQDIVKFNALLAEMGLTAATGESLTAGLISGAIASASGASSVLAGGAITYTNEEKIRQLDVRKEILDQFTAVSAETAHDMANGVILNFGVNVGIVVTGYAEHDDPALNGLVYIGVATNFNKASGSEVTGLPEVQVFEHRYEHGGRNDVRAQVVDDAILHATNIVTQKLDLK
jgi:PncC family amidohydrolase